MSAIATAPITAVPSILVSPASALAPGLGAILGYDRLQSETWRHRHDGGTSAQAGRRGFQPAFRHGLTGEVFPSRFDDGSPAPCHMLGGIPDCYVIERDPVNGMVLAVDPDIEAGFERDGRFFTRAEAARAAQ